MDSAQWTVLRGLLGENGATALADLLQERGDSVLSIATDRFERRLGEECGKLRGEMLDMRAELRSDMTLLRADMAKLGADLRGDFKVEIANTRADLLKWSFLFWVGQVAATTALVTALR